MPEPASDRFDESLAHPAWLEGVFRFVIARRVWVVILFALLLPPCIWLGLGIPQDNSLDKLIVESDPQSITARRFAEAFGGGEFLVVTAEAEDPFAPPVLERFVELEGALGRLPGVSATSLVGVYRRARAGFEPTVEGAEALRRFATSTDLFRQQGLFGDHWLAVACVLDVKDTASRRALLASVQSTLAPFERTPLPFTALRKVGQPLVNAALDAESASTGWRYFPLFALFVVLLTLVLYRSWRALGAILATLGVTAAATLGFIGATGGVFTIVSSLVPMTVLITSTATLVYIHSRYVECPPGVTPEEHQVVALANKFIACTASIFAAAVGFAALGVSKIKPIREMGLWVAAGLVLTWLIAFTLFPALQRLLRTPTMQERRIAGAWMLRYSQALPLLSYRLRWVLVPSALAICVAGVLALTGVPGLFPGMHLETDALEYIDHDSQLYRDTRLLERQTAGLSMTEVWLSGGKPGSITDPGVLRGLSRYEEALRADPRIGSVIGVPTIARMIRYLGGEGDSFPTDDDGLQALADQLDTLLSREPMLARYVDGKTLGDTHLTVITRTGDYQGFVALEKLLAETWQRTCAGSPELGQLHLEITGLSALQAKISYHLVPTLVESLGLSVVIIYGAFLLVFRSGLARLMAMIPSLFAILGMFVFMRLAGISLNVATILIASTVLGTSENDQIHFFFHYQERHRRAEKEGALEGIRDGHGGLLHGPATELALRHTLHVVGRAILFATLINAGGFLAFTMANLPPIRQFGLLSAVAFLLSLIADFTALPAALWLLSRQRPAPPASTGTGTITPTEAPREPGSPAPAAARSA